MKSRGLLLLILLIGLLARLNFATWPPNFDTMNYYIDSRIMLSTGNIYLEQTYYNYTPLWAWVTYFVGLLGGDFNFNIHVFLTLIDLALAGCIGITAQRYFRLGMLAFMMYWLNPVSIWLVGYWGSFDVLAAMPLMVAIAFLPRLKHWQIWGLCTLALIIKHNTLFCVWMIFVYLYRPRWAIIAMLASAAAFLATFLPYRDSLDAIITNVFAYGGGIRQYGFGLILPRFLHVPLFFSVMTALPFFAKKRGLTLPEAMIAAALGLFIFQYGVSSTTSIIVVIWAALKPDRWFLVICGAVLLVILAMALQPKLIMIPLMIAWVVYAVRLVMVFRVRGSDTAPKAAV